MLRYIGVMFLAITVGTSSAYAADQCATRKEKIALDTRALQSQLMVAAISCNQQVNYNQFVTKYNRYLSEQGQVMKRYFTRIYSGGGVQQMNQFVTTMANSSSRASLRQEENAFCQRSAEFFSKLISGNEDQLLSLSGGFQLEGMHGVGLCATEIASTNL